MNELIIVRNLFRDYRNGSGIIHALDNVSFTVREGEFVSIIGQSGSGKSTLMNILGCLDKQSGGKYILSGTDISALSERQLALLRSRVIGFVFQSFNLIPTLTALQNVELPLIYRRIPKKQRIYSAERALDMVGLSARKKHRPGELSGGQQQRTAIARAIAGKPRLLLADEPTGSLDKSAGENVLSVIEELNRSGVTVVMITHDSSIASRAKRSIKISYGLITS